MKTGVPYTFDLDWIKLVQLTAVNTLRWLITNTWVQVTLTWLFVENEVDNYREQQL